MRREYAALSKLVGRNFAVMDDGCGIYLTPVGEVRDMDGRLILPAYPGRAALYQSNLDGNGQSSAPDSSHPPLVQSVNGQTGDVNLTASDVGALPANTKIPSATSELTNSSGFITNAVSDLVNYYQKSETYTRDEINQRISAIPKFTIRVVSALPTSGISETTIYLVGGGADSDLYTEYIFVNGVWEILGSQRVDLTGYATETWVIGQMAGYQPKGDYALRSEIPSVPTKVSQLTNDAGYLTQHQDISGKLDADKLPEAVNDALAQAKASGAFDGKDGHTPQKGVDYFDGKDGSDANVTAENIASALGYTPADAKTVRHLSDKMESDEYQEDIVQQVIAALGTPVFGTVDENKHITLSGHLVDGTYSISYEDRDGFTTDVCTINKTSAPSYTNQLDVAGYQTGHRLSSTGEPSSVTGTNPTFITGYIPANDQSVVRLKNCFIDVDGINGFNSADTTAYYGKAVNSLMITLCNSSQAILNVLSWYNFDTSEYISDAVKDSDGHVTQFKINRSGIAYIRLTLGGDAPNAILTIDEPITD